MYTVEIADGGNGVAEVRGNVSELMEDLHQAISKLILRPS